MSAPYTLKKLTEVEDSGAKFGLDAIQEARFAKDDLEAADTGVSYQRLKPGKRQQFGHRHEHAEEVYVVLAGSGRVLLDGEPRELRQWDAVRVAPEVVRAFEAGPDGLEFLATGPHHPSDGEPVDDPWVN